MNLFSENGIRNVWKVDSTTQEKLILFDDFDWALMKNIDVHKFSNFCLNSDHVLS